MMRTPLIESIGERLRDQRGFTLTELMVALMAGMVVLIAIFTLIDVTGRGSTRITGTVEANQRARPVMTRVMDLLSSTCVGAEVRPIQAGSDANTLTFLHQTGDDVVLTPTLRRLDATGGSLVDSVYPATGGQAPSWTFASAPSSTRTMLEFVSPAQSGSPTQSVPYFRYYAYSGDDISATPLPTPLNAADAARTARVDVAYSTRSVSSGVNPGKNPPSVSLFDSAVLRVSAPSESTAAENLPCA